MLGRSPRLPLDHALEPLRDSESAAGRVPAAHEFAARFKPLWQGAQQKLQQSQAEQKRYADRHRREERFAVGDLVLLSVKDLTFAHADDIKRSAKFAGRFVGPFAVKSVVNDNAYELDLPPQLPIHPTQNVSKLRRWRASPAAFASRPQPHNHPAPELVDAAGNAS